MSATVFNESARHVHRLRLRAPDSSLAARARHLLEDALRTATLPVHGGRILLIKHLRLGGFAANISPQTLSLAIEQQVATLGTRFVHASQPAADTAPAVWFRDALEAHVLLALRIASGATAAEWFWSLAVPDVQRESTASEQVRAIVLSLARLPEAPAALPVFAREIASHGHASILIECLDESDGKQLLIAARAPMVAQDIQPDTVVSRADISERHASSRYFATAMRLAAKAGRSASHSAVRWMAAMLAMESFSPPDGSTYSETSVQASSKSAASNRADEDALSPQNVAVTSRRTSRAREAEQLPSSSLHSEERAHAEARFAARAIAEAGVNASLETDNEVSTPARKAAREASRSDYSPVPWPTGIPTAAGGMLFLIHVLVRVGFVKWLENEPEWQPLRIERRIFRSLCVRMKLPEEDPMWLLATVGPLTPSPARGGRLGRGSSIPGAPIPTFPRKRGKGSEPQALLPTETHHLANEDFINAVTRAWLNSCRHWLRRHAQLGLLTLVSRPARASITPTHVDLLFDLANVDLAVRRAGLDFDPGWVPWLGRVVSFHYERNP